MMTSSADLPGYLGCGSTGMPRPSSLTDRKPSASSLTSMVLAKPATASSIELSSTSANRWCRARSSVPPMYMPGRLRTGSRPSSTSMSAAEDSPGADGLAAGGGLDGGGGGGIGRGVGSTCGSTLLSSGAAGTGARASSSPNREGVLSEEDISGSLGDSNAGASYGGPGVPRKESGR